MDSSTSTSAEASNYLKTKFADFVRTQPGLVVDGLSLKCSVSGLVLIQVTQLNPDKFVLEVVMGPHRFSTGYPQSYAFEVLRLHRICQDAPKDAVGPLFEALVDAQGRQYKAGFEFVEFSVSTTGNRVIILNIDQRKTRKGNLTTYRAAIVLNENQWWWEGKPIAPTKLADFIDRIAAGQRAFLSLVEVK